MSEVLNGKPKPRRKEANGNTAPDATASNEAILRRLRTVRWEEKDGYYSTHVREEDAERYHRFFKAMGSQLRADGLEFDNVEASGSRLAGTSVPNPLEGGSGRLAEIRLSAEDMEALQIDPKGLRR